MGNNHTPIMHSLLKNAIAAAIKAGEEILTIYNTDFNVETKADNSPLTEADKKSHDVIKSALSIFDIPLLSEEDRHDSYEKRKHWKKCWLIDPLDGTKEFIKRNGEFTVNIALIESGLPVLGVVHVPVTGKTYYSSFETGSYIFNINKNNKTPVEDYINNATKLTGAQNPIIYTIVASRSHSTIETENFIADKRKQFGNINCISSGSSIKICLVAEGKANVYPRFAPTMEWDTAAGHAVAKFAGCKVYDYNNRCELTYNKESLVNPSFIVERIQYIL